MIARTELDAFKIKMVVLIARASALVKQGSGKDQLRAHLKTDDLGWHFDFTGEQLDGFYTELLQAE